ncbi:MAG: response regulator transcription factor, partial [Bacteroidales bacterium]|nr:response regulator transcription factor [Bacteroidales bacterium]
IFVTAFDQYSIKAIRSEAFDYLVKPIDLDELNAALNRFRQKKENLQIPQGWNLSEREKEVVTLVLTGKTSAQIAQELFLSKFTIDAHRKKILEKCGCNNFNELMGLVK